MEQFGDGPPLRNQPVLEILLLELLEQFERHHPHAVPMIQEGFERCVASEAAHIFSLAALLRPGRGQQENPRLERISRFVADQSQVVQSVVWTAALDAVLLAGGRLCAN
jgi:hypothetical protein